MIKKQSRFFTHILNYITNLLKRPKAHLTSKQLHSTYWGKIFSIPVITTLWFLSKVHPDIERVTAQKISKKWHFKPIPVIEALSNEAIDYKKGKIIEINKNMDVQTKVLDFITFNELINNFPFAEIRDCGCRSIVKQCDTPTKTCLRLKWTVDISKSLGNFSKDRLASQEDIDKVLEISDKYSLVHMTLHRPDLDHIYVVCNCCDCCCIGFREFKAHAVPMMVGSKYVAKIETDKCTGCYHCINYRCRFQAILKVNEDGTIIDPREEDKKRFNRRWRKWSENRKGWGNKIHNDPPSWNRIKEKHKGRWYAQIDSSRCFGCGNCASPKYGCPEGAIKLYLRK